MSRWEFMRKLEELLSDISPNEREEALQYYNDYFNDAGRENEQEVVRALGTPEQVAQVVKEGLGDSLGEGGEFTENGFTRSSGAVQNELMRKTGTDACKGDTREDNVHKGDTCENDTREDNVHEGDTRKNAVRKDDACRDGVREGDARRDGIRRDDVRENGAREDNVRKDGAGADSSGDGGEDRDRDGVPTGSTASGTYTDSSYTGSPHTGSSRGQASYHGPQGGPRPGYSAGKKKEMPSWEVVLIVIGCIFLSPLIISLVSSLVAAIISVVGVVLGIAFGMGVAVFVLYAVAIALIIAGFGCILVHPAVGLGLLGGGLICASLGVLCMILFVFLAGKCIPAVCKWISGLIKKVMKRRRGMR